MRVLSWGDWRQRLALAGLLVIVSLQLVPLTSYAQNLGQSPATGQAVQGQTAAQPEGAVLNLVLSENSIVLSWAVLKVVRAVRSIGRCIHVR